MAGHARTPLWHPTPDGGRGGDSARPGPRWIISLRAAIVVLAMAGATVAVLWISSATVAGTSSEAEPAKVMVPAPPAGATPGATPEPARTGASEASTTNPASATGAAVMLHVVGAVKRPGVVTLPPGSRVFQAVAAAGGALPGAELAAINLAAVVVDGDQVMVPTHEQWLAEPKPPPGPGTPTSGGKPAILNLNTATAEELDGLPGVGPVLAERILQWRTEHGPFTTVDEIDAVPGIGAKMLANLRGLVRTS